VGRRGHREGEAGLEVGLLEDGVHAPAVGHLELAVEVDLVVDRVDEAVQALTGVRVAAGGGDDHDVLRRQAGQAHPAVRVVRGRVEVGAVEGHPLDRAADEVEEGLGARLGAGERDRAAGREGLRPGRDVELDVVTVDGDEGGAGGGLLTGEVRAGHGVSLRGGTGGGAGRAPTGRRTILSRGPESPKSLDRMAGWRHV